MSTGSNESSSADGQPRSKAQIEADLEATRDHLAETVDALGHKLDVRARSSEKVAAVRREHGRTLGIASGAVVIVVVLLVVRRRRRRRRK